MLTQEIQVGEYTHILNLGRLIKGRLGDKLNLRDTGIQGFWNHKIFLTFSRLMNVNFMYSYLLVTPFKSFFSWSNLTIPNLIRKSSFPLSGKNIAYSFVLTMKS